MGRFAKGSLVAGGYLVALLGAAGAVFLQNLATPASVAQSSSGMTAFGDTLLFLGAFAFLCIPPTALGLWYLRGCQRCWDLAAALSLALALTGPLALALRAFIQVQQLWHGGWVWGDLLAMLRGFGAPVLALGFGVCSFLSPTKTGKYGFLLAALVEVLVTLYVLVVFLLFQRFA